eukprot:CAMPEP_0206493340 /NCGR_PEP_ID=MMETSP0324_2-20121206/46892_1 /ASSEMBLY_ACC=CAM_ASM_000836 /TAXON_ID=2866 /ORGANISM="Crypthecodinium cohnii, Strain Seligo" /LENGTH=364 /DNA_ID=CAMNT_0053976421 /DNA_START=8 /DNA_END=1102 /DNA_ORIENTATION=+
MSLSGSAPAGVRIVVGYQCMLTVLSLMLPLERLLGLSLAAVCSGKLWTPPLFWAVSRLGTSPGLALVLAVLSSLAALSYLPRLEQDLGTLRFFCWIFLVSTAVGCLYLLICLLACLLVDSTWFYSSSCGLWPLLVAAMTLHHLEELPAPAHSHSHSHSHSAAAAAATTLLFFGLLPVPKRWYPLALVCLFSLLNLRLELDLLAAWIVAVGMYHSKPGSLPLHPSVARWRLPLESFIPTLAIAQHFEDTSKGQSLNGSAVSAAASSESALAIFLRSARDGVIRSSPASLKQYYISADTVAYGFAAHRAGDEETSFWTGGGSSSGNGASSRYYTHGHAATAGVAAAAAAAPKFPAFSGVGQRLGQV